MNIIGIVGEYNPFHYGHLYHLNETKKLFGDCAVVCAMSGDFVQRGEAALFDKFTRAEAACRSGVDLVLELPVKWALSSAEGFARGAVQLLSYAGAEYISFGSECGDISVLQSTAELLCDRNVIEKIKEKMRTEKELSFASARQLVISEYSQTSADAVSSPNNILAIEYIKAIRTIGTDMKPVTVKRTGSAHDCLDESDIPCASAIRKRFEAGECIEKYIPKEAYSVYLKAIEEGRVIDRELMDAVLLSRLRMFERDYYNALPDASDGLGDRLFKASRSCTYPDEMYTSAKTKKYTMSRIKRACMCACIGIKAETETTEIPYLRVLAANKNGRIILKNMVKDDIHPVITKPGSVYYLDRKCQKVFAAGVSANDLYVMGYREKKSRYGGQDWKTSPEIVEN